jgi:hypothetical protein
MNLSRLNVSLDSKDSWEADPFPDVFSSLLLAFMTGFQHNFSYTWPDVLFQEAMANTDWRGARHFLSREVKATGMAQARVYWSEVMPFYCLQSNIYPGIGLGNKWNCNPESRLVYLFQFTCAGG